jgi:hypothetical protein
MYWYGIPGFGFRAQFKYRCSCKIQTQFYECFLFRDSILAASDQRPLLLNIFKVKGKAKRQSTVHCTVIHVQLLLHEGGY